MSAQEQTKSRIKREFTQHLVVFVLNNGKVIPKIIQTRNQESVLAVKPKNTVIVLVHSEYIIEIRGISEKIRLEDENFKEDEAFVFGEVLGLEEVEKNVNPLSIMGFTYNSMLSGMDDEEYLNLKFVKTGETYTTLPKKFTKM